MRRTIISTIIATIIATILAFFLTVLYLKKSVINSKVAVIQTVDTTSVDTTSCVVIEKQKIKRITDEIFYWNKDMDSLEAELLAVSIIYASRYLLLDVDREEFLTKLIAIESAFNCSAISEKNAVGLMQVTPKYWVGNAPAVKRKEDLFNPLKNLVAGVYILNHYYEVSGGDIKKTVHLYSGGAKRHHKYLGVFYGER